MFHKGFRTPRRARLTWLARPRFVIAYRIVLCVSYDLHATLPERHIG
jgi:microcystin degradation protein MlrC